MSQSIRDKKDKITVPRLQAMHRQGEKLTMLTAYDYTMARLVDEAGIDVVLVGDSLGMVIQGHANTIPVTIEDLIYHTRCVAKGVTRAHIMADMPFLSYQVSFDEAVLNAGLLLKAGAESVKIEGGEEIADLVWYLNKIGIPVMAHIGLKPQSVHTMGGYKIQGKLSHDAEIILNEAQVMEEAGAFALLLEGIPLELAQKISETVTIPTIGIGSGPHCSGQVLVVTDLLGANPDFKPRFVKNYANFHEISQNAFGAYIQDVRSGKFPDQEHSVCRELQIVQSDPTETPLKNDKIKKKPAKQSKEK